MKKVKPIRFPLIASYHTIAVYTVDTKLQVGRFVTPLRLFCAHDLTSDVSKSKPDAVEALRRLGWHLVACELLLNKCKELDIPFTIAEELPPDELILQKAKESGILLRSVYFDSHLYDQVDQDLKKDGFYDALGQGLEGLRKLVEEGKTTVREVSPGHDPVAGAKALRRR